MEDLKNKFKEIIYAGYYDDIHEYILEVRKEDLIKLLEEVLDIENLKIM